MPAAGQGRSAAIAAILAFLTLWGGSTAYLFATGDEDWFTAILVMAVFGLALSGVSWLLTRGAAAAPIEVRRPALESVFLLIYLALYAVLFLGFGMSAARSLVPPGPNQEMFVMGLKLAVHVALPALLLALLGARLAPLFQAGLSGRKFWRTLIVMGAILLALLCVISPSLRNIAETGAGAGVLVWAAPLSFAWIAVEAGLNEEFLFRAVMQTRLTAWFRSPWAGVCVTAMLFGAAHVPGLYLRGGADAHGASADLLQVIAYSLGVLAPMGLLFGLIYARTKSLLLVVLLHGLVDVLPNMDEFIRTWT